MLEGQRQRIADAPTVADARGLAVFAELLAADAASPGEPIQLADLEVENADVRGPGSCHYSTGEIIAVVIGFILFIIPGIILLIVLC